MKIIYADCFSGISGDMLLGALIELGVDKDWLQSELSAIQIEPFKIEIKRIKKGAIGCTQFRVISQGGKSLYRGFEQIKHSILKSRLKDKIKSQSLEIFHHIAEVESVIHTITIQEVHFHEIGAIDSIVDIVGTVIACDYLGIRDFFSSPLPLGRGSTTTEHGPIPIPAPATLAILEGVPVLHTDIETELVTPTGAALIKHLSRGFGLPPEMVIKAIGYGAGEKDLTDRPNCLRLIMGETAENLQGGYEDYIEVAECDIDDMPPEFYTYLMERLFSEGALDVSLSHTIMKKGRPGVRVTVLSEIGSVQRLVNILLTETTTIGIRDYRAHRNKALRKIETIQTEYGPVRVKYAFGKNSLLNISPEYEDCLQIARKYNRPLKIIYQEITARALKKLNIVDKQKI